MLNSFFLNGTKAEQNLIQDLVNEQLRMYGIEVYYLPRRYMTTNTVIREVIESNFTDAFPLEAYVENYEGYTGQGTILSKFGIENRDDLNLVISRERYENYIAPLIRNVPNIELSGRPKEGDLIYFPLGDRLFEIKFVEHEQPFYQLQKNYVYQLRCELFRYEDEVIDTDIPEIDDTIEQIGYIQTLSLVGSGVGQTATATAHICAQGAVNDISVTNIGKEYTTTPIVAFSSAPDGGVTATGIASVSYEHPHCSGKNGVVVAIYLTNAGCGYTVAPTIDIITPDGYSGVGAAATCGITTAGDGGSVQYVTIDDGGAGYIFPPSVSFGISTSTTYDDDTVTVDSTEYTYDMTGETDGILRAATGVSTISAVGLVTAIYVTDGGAGYDVAPVVTVSAPQSLSTSSSVGVGTFIFNEIVTGQTSGTTARVKEYSEVTFKLEISIVDGHFQTGEIIVGSESGASYLISGVEEFDLVTPYADNDTIELEADSIIDFSVTNPFGMP